MVNVRTMGVHSYVESIFSLSNMLNFAFPVLNYIDDIAGLTGSSGFNFIKGSTGCLPGEFINGSYLRACFTTGVATLTVTLI